MATTLIEDFSVEPRVADAPKGETERAEEKPAAEVGREIETMRRRERERAQRLWAY